MKIKLFSNLLPQNCLRITPVKEKSNQQRYLSNISNIAFPSLLRYISKPHHATCYKSAAVATTEGTSATRCLGNPPNAVATQPLSILRRGEIKHSFIGGEVIPVSQLLKKRDIDPSNSGFTLIEVLVAIVIVSILSAIAAPSWLGFVARQRLNKANDSVFAALQQAQREAKKNKRSYSVSIQLNNSIPQVSVHPRHSSLAGLQSHFAHRHLPTRPCCRIHGSRTSSPGIDCWCRQTRSR